MTDKPKKLSDTARALLTVAATRCDHLIRPPRLPIAAARQVVRSLLNAELAEEVPAPIDDAGYGWRTSKDGGVLVLRATALGLAQLGDGEAGTPTPAPDRARDLWNHMAAFRLSGGSGRPGCRSYLDARTERPCRPLASRLGPSQHPPQRQSRASRHGGLRQAAQALLDFL